MKKHKKNDIQELYYNKYTHWAKINILLNMLRQVKDLPLVSKTENPYRIPTKKVKRGEVV